MKLRVGIITAIALLSAAVTGNCRLLESYQQLTARYGQPVDSSTGEPRWYLFEKDGLQIHVTMLKGLSHCEVYVPKDPSDSLSAAQVGKLFGLNSGGKPLYKSTKDSTDTDDFFICEDGDMIGTIRKVGLHRGCMVATPEYLAKGVKSQ
jgi:hypothetical protein